MASAEEPARPAGAPAHDQCDASSAWRKRLERREAMPGGPREHEQADHHSDAAARPGREQQVPSLEGDRDERRRQGDRHQTPGRAVPREHASERERGRDRDATNREERDQPLCTKRRSLGTCHLSFKRMDGGRMMQSHPARVRARRDWVARPSNWDCRSGGRVSGRRGRPGRRVGPNPAPLPDQRGDLSGLRGRRPRRASCRRGGRAEVGKRRSDRAGLE